jgi:SAM-dependent methyltransferase
MLRKLLGSIARRTLPKPVLAAYRNHRAARRSTEDVFTQIYSRNEWGGRPGEFYSGSGTAYTVVAAPYVANLVRELTNLQAERLRVVDLGCGDFRIGRQLAPACAAYVGVDIVHPLVSYNQRMFGSETVSFVHANIIEDPLPPGDICVVRQVLQHLSNAQILAVLPKLNQYRWCFITEHHPSDSRFLAANLDKTHGRDIRLTEGSGVYLDAPPFNIPQAHLRLLFELAGPLDLGNGDAGIIRTYLYSPTG